MNSQNQQPSRTTYLRQWQIIGDRKKKIPAPILDIGSATLWRWVVSGGFPKPYKMSGGVTAWKTTEVEAWLLSRNPTQT